MNDGTDLLQAVAIRILGRYLEAAGFGDVILTNGRDGIAGKSVDIVCSSAGSKRRVKVKADPYYGTDPREIGDRSLPFYRSDAGLYALEAVADSLTRAPGWMFASEADDLYYYCLAITQTQEEVAALMSGPDEVFFGELKVARDDLRILPMAAARRWFEEHFEDYTPRPVMSGTIPSWYRLVPRGDMERSVPGVRNIGPVFGTLPII